MNNLNRLSDDTYKAIRRLIACIDRDNNLSIKDLNKMADSLNAFCIESINKFIVGQKKHGGSIIDKDLDKEFNEEFIDMFWYKEAIKWKSNEKENKEKEEIIDTSQVEQQSNSSG